MPSKTYATTILADPDGGSMTTIDVPFDPKAVFGKARAPVVVTLNGYRFRSTTFTMKGQRFVPLCREHREGAGVRAGQRLKVTLTLDEAPRVVKPPTDLVKALKAAKALDAFSAMSYTHQREHVQAIEDAKKPETRARRIQNCVAMVSACVAKKATTSKA